MVWFPSAARKAELKQSIIIMKSINLLLSVFKPDKHRLHSIFLASLNELLMVLPHTGH